jgi:putative transcriptional regulator
MIKINIAELLGKHKMTRNQLAKATGIRPNTISGYYYETIKRIETGHLELFCKVFKCQVSDILEYREDDKNE